MEEVSLNTEPAYDEKSKEFEIEGECAMAEFVGEDGIIEGENPLPPALGMEFESYDDVYYFYNCYARQQGFGVRVSNTWYRKTKEKYRGKLSCSSAGFKKKSQANRPRPETRTGCPAMVKFRLMENRRWRIIEVELDHNHLISPVCAISYKSHKTLALGTKRPLLQEDCADDVQNIRLFRTVVIDAEDDGGNFFVEEQESGDNKSDQFNQLKLKLGDAEAIQNTFCQLQLMNPNFFYVMDLNEKGHLRNLFWTEPRARGYYSYFSDVISIDTSCLTEKYEVPLVVFTGVNHHGQSLFLGCGFLAGQTMESYIWLFRAWLTYMLGRSPQTIITHRCKLLQTAVAEVFPRSLHFLSLLDIMKKVPEHLGGFHEYESVNSAFARAVYESLTADEFEVAWDDMIQIYGISDDKWLQILYDDRKKWVPAYLKETLFAGLFPIKEGERIISPFDRYLHENTSLKDFLGSYEQAIEEIHRREAVADSESRNSSLRLKSRFYFELQISKLYTDNMFKKFQYEVEGMFSCFGTRQADINGTIITYVVEEQTPIEENKTEIKEYEVIYNTSESEVVCVCNLFNLKGYLCKHALNILNRNGLEEIPPVYILSRWRKDIDRNYAFDYKSGGIDINNPLHRYDDLYKCMVQVVEEGKMSNDRYKVGLQALDDLLNKFRIAEDNNV